MATDERDPQKIAGDIAKSVAAKLATELAVELTAQIEQALKGKNLGERREKPPLLLEVR